MKRDFIKSLGIEDKETIDKILDENSADIGRAKGNVDEYKSQIAQLTSQLNDKTTELNTLKESTNDYETLKTKVTDLETEKTNLQTELNTKLSQLQKTHTIESTVRDAKAKNVKAVMALLDMDKITFENGELAGVHEQLEALQKGEDTSFLFGESQAAPPAGTKPNLPPAGGNGSTPPSGKSFTDAIAAALTNN